MITIEQPVKRPRIAGAFIVHGFPPNKPGGPGGKAGIGGKAHTVAMMVRQLGGKITRFR